MADSSLRQHMERTHGILFLQVRGRGRRGRRTGVIQGVVPSYSKVGGLPGGGMPGQGKKTRRLRKFFMFCHWKSRVAIFQEGTEPLPRCDQCGMHMQAVRLLKHRESHNCHKLMERRL